MNFWNELEKFFDKDKKLNKKDITIYVDSLVKKGILTLEKAKAFKKKMEIKEDFH